MSANSVPATPLSGPRTRPRRGTRVLALLLSLAFPGLGQAFQGWLGRGIAFAAAAFLWRALYEASPYGVIAAPALVGPAVVLLLLALGAVLVLLAAGDAARAPKAQTRTLGHWLLYAAIVAGPILPGAISPLGWTQYSIPSGSMVPTLDISDHVLGIEGYYDRFTPARGDVVTFREHDITFIKRIIGLPGDTVEMRDNVLYVNGAQAGLQPLEPLAVSLSNCGGGPFPRYLETLPGGARHVILLGCGPGPFRDMAPVAVPPDHYFMLGDNRDNSDDSRDTGGEVGIVARDALLARAVFIPFSLDRPPPWRIDWSRIALRIE